MYADLLLFIDRRNHSANWQQILQKSIDRYKSKNIIVSKNPEKSIKFYTPSLLASFRAKQFLQKSLTQLIGLIKMDQKIIVFLISELI